jgi:hypothetical protein
MSHIPPWSSTGGGRCSTATRASACWSLAALSFFSISASVSTATDVTVEELVIEAFYPADATTAAALTSVG